VEAGAVAPAKVRKRAKARARRRKTLAVRAAVLPQITAALRFPTHAETEAV
jgi:hypothetical protein